VLPGVTIRAVIVRKENVLLLPASELAERLEGQSVRQVGRRGKFLLIHCADVVLVVHLGMTGQLTYWDHNVADSPGFIVQKSTGLQQARQHAVDKHTHVSFDFTDGNRLHYRDIRMFGNMRLVDEHALRNEAPFDALGPEPLTPDFTFEAFNSRLAATKRVIKAVLLDQRVVAGVGNIYADEALFRARLRPNWMACRLTRAERERLFEAIPAVLEQGIAFGGTSMSDYIDSDGQRGSNQEALWAYGRTGEPCRVCETPIRRIVVAQRGSHYCPQCQSRARVKA